MFKNEVTRNSRWNRSIKRRYLPKLLQSHTKTFNRIIERRIALELQEEHGLLWAKAAQAAIAIWGNQL